MFAAALVVFREVLEAALIVGIIMSATRGVPYRGRYISLGILGGTVGAVLVAVFTNSIAGLFEGIGQGNRQRCNPIHRRSVDWLACRVDEQTWSGNCRTYETGWPESRQGHRLNVNSGNGCRACRSSRRFGNCPDLAGLMDE